MEPTLNRVYYESMFFLVLSILMRLPEGNYYYYLLIEGVWVAS
jgi:hypothetical protein